MCSPVCGEPSTDGIDGWRVGGYTQDDGMDLKVVIDSVADLFRPNNRKPVVIGLGLCMLAAFSGSNTIIYYASCVFEELGLEGDNLLTWAVAIPNIAGALIALVRRLHVGLVSHAASTSGSEWPCAVQMVPY